VRLEGGVVVGQFRQRVDGHEMLLCG
jgi:hypothetical protein